MSSSWEDSPSGGGVRSLLGVFKREDGVRRRLETRLKGFSSTFRRRDLWSSSSSRWSRTSNEAIVRRMNRSVEGVGCERT